MSLAIVSKSLKYKGVTITSLSRNSLIALSILTIVFIAIISLPSSNPKRDASLKNLHLLTTLPSTVKSTSFLEQRVSMYNDFSNRLYPQMNQSTQGSFVYAK